MGVKSPYFISLVVIPSLLDYVSDVTEMQILIFKVTASSSVSAPLAAEASLHTACMKYCFICSVKMCIHHSAGKRRDKPLTEDAIVDIYKVITERKIISSIGTHRAAHLLTVRKRVVMVMRQQVIY